MKIDNSNIQLHTPERLKHSLDEPESPPAKRIEPRVGSIANTRLSSPSPESLSSRSRSSSPLSVRSEIASPIDLSIYPGALSSETSQADNSQTLPEIDDRPLSPLSKVKSELRKIQFTSPSGGQGRDWLALREKTRAASSTWAKDRLHRLSPQLSLLSPVDVINCPSYNRMRVEREGRTVFIHGNTVNSQGVAFRCHQLPGEHTRDNIWLSLWNDAGMPGAEGASTILKLSTEDCGMACDIPISEDYWPSGQSVNIQTLKNQCVSSYNRILAQFQNVASKEALVRREAAKTHCCYLVDRVNLINRIQGSNEILYKAFKTQDGITVSFHDSVPAPLLPKVHVRTFHLTKENEKRTVTQIDYPNWKDYSAQSARDLVQLRKVFKSIPGIDKQAPAHIHCRAGVGRTGTFVAYCAIMNAIEKAVAKDNLSAIDPRQLVQDTILELRSQRDHQMVQTKDQAQMLVEAVMLSLDDLYT